jgi:uncharacterized protein (TIGR02646 family)
MKYIQKDIKNEPAELRDYRNKTPNASYKGYNDTIKDNDEDRHPLREALLKEQGYLCAYCMGRISVTERINGKPKVEVEHFKPQAKYPDLDLKYENLLGVCNGLSFTYPENKAVHHCDKTTGVNGKIQGNVELRKLDPRDKNCERLIKYNPGGEILSLNGDVDIEFDLNEVLNLNNTVLKKARKAVIDAAKELLLKRKPHQQWNKVYLKAELENWLSLNRNGQFKKYCMAAAWFIESLLAKPHYNK